MFQEKNGNIIICDNKSNKILIEKAIKLYFNDTDILISLLIRNVLSLSIWFFEDKQKEVLMRYINELGLEYVGYKYGYNYFIDILIDYEK